MGMSSSQELLRHARQLVRITDDEYSGDAAIRDEKGLRRLDPSIDIAQQTGLAIDCRHAIVHPAGMLMLQRPEHTGNACRTVQDAMEGWHLAAAVADKG